MKWMYILFIVSYGDMKYEIHMLQKHQVTNQAYNILL